MSAIEDSRFHGSSARDIASLVSAALSVDVIARRVQLQQLMYWAAQTMIGSAAPTESGGALFHFPYDELPVYTGDRDSVDDDARALIGALSTLVESINDTPELFRAVARKSERWPALVGARNETEKDADADVVLRQMQSRLEIGSEAQLRFRQRLNVQGAGRPVSRHAPATAALLVHLGEVMAFWNADVRTRRAWGSCRHAGFRRSIVWQQKAKSLRPLFRSASTESKGSVREWFDVIWTKINEEHVDPFGRSRPEIDPHVLSTLHGVFKVLQIAPTTAESPRTRDLTYEAIHCYLSVIPASGWYSPDDPELWDDIPAEASQINWQARARELPPIPFDFAGPANRRPPFAKWLHAARHPIREWLKCAYHLDARARFLHLPNLRPLGFCERKKALEKLDGPERRYPPRWADSGGPVFSGTAECKARDAIRKKLQMALMAIAPKHAPEP